MLQTRAARIIGAVNALLIAVVALIAYLASWSPEMTALVLGIVAAVIVLAGAIFTESQVYSKDSVARIESAGQPDGTTVTTDLTVMPYSPPDS